MKSSFFAIMLSAILMISIANAQPGGMMGVAEELDLTDDQIEKIGDLRFQHQKAMIKKGAKLEEARLELKNLMRQSKVDKKAAISRQEEISSVQSEIARMKLNHRLEMREVLTENQLKKWQEFRRKDRLFGPGRMGPEHEGPGKGPHPGMGHGGKDCPGR